MQLDISVMLTLQITIIICHCMTKILLKKIQKYGRIYQNRYIRVSSPFNFPFISRFLFILVFLDIVYLLFSLKLQCPLAKAFLFFSGCYVLMFYAMDHHLVTHSLKSSYDFMKYCFFKISSCGYVIESIYFICLFKISISSSKRYFVLLMWYELKVDSKLFSPLFSMIHIFILF